MQPAATAHHEVEGRSRRQDSLVELGAPRFSAVLTCHVLLLASTANGSWEGCTATASQKSTGIWPCPVVCFFFAPRALLILLCVSCLCRGCFWYQLLIVEPEYRRFVDCVLRLRNHVGGWTEDNIKKDEDGPDTTRWFSFL